jgi:four helix bundle protein
MRNYQKLEAWKAAIRLAKEAYLLVKDYPKEEVYSLVSQTKRSAVSIPVNIAEGMGRQYKKDTLQFLHIARGSIYELETLLNIAVMIGILSKSKFSEIQAVINDCYGLLNGLINYIRNSNLK